MKKKTIIVSMILLLSIILLVISIIPYFDYYYSNGTVPLLNYFFRNLPLTILGTLGAKYSIKKYLNCFELNFNN